MQLTLPPASTWWFTGLPGAGKTTLAEAWAQALRSTGRAACVLDGDVLRSGLSSDLGFGPADRQEQARRTAELGRVLNANGICALVALVSPTRAGREMARNIIGHSHFIEVFVSTPLATCRARDPKGLYKRAATDPALGLTGAQSPYEPPLHPIITLDTSVTSVAQALLLLQSTVGK
jgi:adenylylsulfate kinase